jgi:hypothetical protein
MKFFPNFFIAYPEILSRLRYIGIMGEYCPPKKKKKNAVRIFLRRLFYKKFFRSEL